MTFVEETGKNLTVSRQNDQDTTHIEGENENERLLLFSDGVIAVALTLATISIRLPTGKQLTNPSEFLTELGPYLLTYLIAFVIVGSYWYEHWRFSDISQTAQQHLLSGIYSFWPRWYFYLSSRTFTAEISI